MTGFDIIFFWVARMMMMGIHFLGEVPFRTVVIHNRVLDEAGAKMSKTKGNVVDPITLIDEFGADALRFTLALAAGQSRDMRIGPTRVETNRNFATKLWNTSRFCEMNGCVTVPGFDPAGVTQTVNQWIVAETAKAIADVTAAIEALRFNDAAGAAYHFVYDVFCDWYIEITKPIIQGTDEAIKAETRATTAWVRDQILKLLHPFMPFITEELWGATATRDRSAAGGRMAEGLGKRRRRHGRDDLGDRPDQGCALGARRNERAGGRQDSAAADRRGYCGEGSAGEEPRSDPDPGARHNSRHG